MGDDDASTAKLRRCIFGGTAILLGVVTALVAICLYVPSMHDAVRSPAFLVGTWAAMLLSLPMMFASLFIDSHAFQRFVHIFVTLAIAALLALVGGHAAHKGVVIVALLSALLIIGAAAAVGDRSGDLSSWGMPLFIGLLVLIAASLLSNIVFRASWLSTGVSLAGVAIFTAFTIYDVNQFTRARSCRYNCCEEGVFSIYTNFANLGVDLVSLFE